MGLFMQLGGILAYQEDVTAAASELAAKALRGLLLDTTTPHPLGHGNSILLDTATPHQ